MAICLCARSISEAKQAVLTAATTHDQHCAPAASGPVQMKWTLSGVSLTTQRRESFSMLCVRHAESATRPQ